MELITYRFDIVNKNAIVEPVLCKNYKSAKLLPNREAVYEQIRKEITGSHTIIFTTKPAVVSALGAIPKGETDKVRLIHDYSRPMVKRLVTMRHNPNSPSVH